MSANVDAILPRYHFRTSPFAPTVGDRGPIQPGLFDATLDPVAEPNTIPYYFDLYDWGRDGLFEGFDETTIFRRSPPPLPPQPLLIIVSGNSVTGRTSLAKRIVKKIADGVGAAAPPLAVNVQFGGLDRAANLYAMADMLAASYQLEHTDDIVTKLVDAVRAAEPSQTTTLDTYMRLFGRLQVFVPRLPRRTVVYLISGTADYKTWATCFEVARNVATYFIVETGSLTEALACVKLMNTNGRAAAVQHIRAKQLTRDTARTYLVQRLDAERPEALRAGSLAPFSESALEGLFAPGVESGDAPVSLPIWRVRKTLRLALEQHADKLAEYGTKHGVPALQALPIDASLIVRNDIQSVSDLISTGRAS